MKKYKPEELQLDREANVPLYVQLENILRKKIDSSEWEKGFRLPTYQKLAQDLGVSLITVQQAIDRLVQDGILYRRQGLGTFVARNDMKVKSNVIGLLLTEVRHPFFSSLAHVIQHEAALHGYTISMCSIGIGQTETFHAIDLLLNNNIDGIITTPALGEHSYSKLLEFRKKGIPVVFIDCHLKDINEDFVQSDHRHGMELILDHLISLGHNRIGMACAQYITLGLKERMNAFQELMKEKGLEFDPSLLQVSHLHDDEGGWDAGRKLLSLREPPTAIVCSNDITAVGVLKSAKEMNVSIPDELSVTGFDDLELSSHLEIPLTTIRQPVEKMGEIAFSILLKRMTGLSEGPKEYHILPLELIIRASTNRKSH